MARKRLSALALLAVGFLFLLAAHSFLSRTGGISPQWGLETNIAVAHTGEELAGPPSIRFKDNLRNDTQYIISFVGDMGWTNEVMTFGNLLYLALITRRVPILVPFEPTHIGFDEAHVPFGEVFDIPRLSAAMNLPILEWNQLKLGGTAGQDEPLGCWSVWATAHKEGIRPLRPRKTKMAERCRVDLSYTPVPEWTTTGQYEHTSFWRLARLSYPSLRAQALRENTRETEKSRHAGHVLPPDEQVLCFDLLYFVSVDEPFDYERQYSPAWHFVLKHAHWTPRLEALANEYMRDMFKLGAGEPIPPFISIHARHGDFRDQCPGQTVDQCFTSLATWKYEVDDLRAQLHVEKGMDPVRVVMLSDEQDEGWWDQVKRMGWYRVDHGKMRTEEKYGKWYPIFIDVVIQSAGKGFLGTETSTLSLLSLRRVVDWNNGSGKLLPYNKHNEHPEVVVT